MLTRFPIAYWGSIYYFQELVKAKYIVFEVFETYQKQTYRNRCSILTANGVKNLSIPVIRTKGSKSLTNEIHIDYSQNWQKDHWRAISSSYASSPFFEHYSSDIQRLLFQKTDCLIEFNHQILEFIISALELPILFSYSTSFEKTVENDKLNHFDIRINQQNYYYQQVFTNKDNFVSNLSILDLLMNLGPMARTILMK
jgi:hypothetical protein